MKLLSIDSVQNLDKGRNTQNKKSTRTAKIAPSNSSEDEYTMKIVLTVRVEAPNREQAEVLASHVAAFLPEDAQRVADAFSPVLMAPQDGSGGRACGQVRQQFSTATAAVTMVTNGTPEEVGTHSKSKVLASNRKRSLHRPLADHANIRSIACSTVRPTTAPLKSRRSTIYTQSTL